jgi:DHA1 family bicyclomycin/chloramphenicol resistance-like MFS transporter
MESAKQAPGRAFALALGLTALITPLAVHLFFPVIPIVKVALGIDDALAYLTFSIALFGMAISTLFYGSLSDRFGRRPVLLSGLALFLIGSVVSALAQTATMLVLARLVQAIGAGCGLALTRAIARDAYSPEHLVKAIAYLTMFGTLGPMVSPFIGGLLVDTLGWRSVFGFALIAGGVITLCAYITIYETHPSAGRKAGEVGVTRSYVELFRHPRFIAFVLQSGFATGAFMTMATASAGLMKELLNRPSTEFGLYFVMFPVGFFLGSLISSRIGNRASTETMVLAGSIMSFITVSTQALFLQFGPVMPLAFFIPGFFLTMSQGIALPYGQAGAMTEVPRFAGTAAGVGVFMQNFFAALFAQFYGIFADGTPQPMAVIACLCGLLCLAAGSVPFLLKRIQPRPVGVT